MAATDTSICLELRSGYTAHFKAQCTLMCRAHLPDLKYLACAVQTARWRQAYAGECFQHKAGIQAELRRFQ